jgi:hypothetical protein
MTRKQEAVLERTRNQCVTKVSFMSFVQNPLFLRVKYVRNVGTLLDVHVRCECDVRLIYIF